MAKQSVLYVFDAKDPLLSVDHMIELFHIFRIQDSEAVFQLIGYDETVYQAFQMYGKIQPPIYQKGESLDQENNSDFWQFSLFPFSIPEHILRSNYQYPTLSYIYWQAIQSNIAAQNQSYDKVYCFSQGIASFYVAEKVQANTKLLFLHLLPFHAHRAYDRVMHMYQSFDYHMTNSKTMYAIGKSTYDLAITYYPNPYRSEVLQRIAKLKRPFDPSFDGIRLLSQMNWKDDTQMDRFVQTCLLLKQNRQLFKWYLLGEHVWEHELRIKLKKYQLTNDVIIINHENNYYPYIAASDLYIEWTSSRLNDHILSDALLLKRTVFSPHPLSKAVRYGVSKRSHVIPAAPDHLYSKIKKQIKDHKIFS
ncbi:group 1 glycosyl transferase [Gracilibacillus halophilus YIM-C55.5]|uniref:Group 1 glycosyl transferase n=1 Tax=Gracilibacillus halophilus YIM-C55.5 TaxID=1308866 RepID=N4W829_9BACI|nr:hypothetical protein [Gracilibacillus halophilus]ENH96428.1 group 1 glycosyl transferase [Gracilibacillus halophilus YIM-C55.5]